MSSWELDTGFEIAAGHLGVTTPPSELLAEIAKQGWEIQRVDAPKSAGFFEAEAKNPHGERAKAVGPTYADALANLLMRVMRTNFMRAAAVRTSMWKSDWTNDLAAVAQAYAKAPVYDPKAAGAWSELAQDSTRRAQVLQTQLQIEVVDAPEPYANAQEMCEDVHKNKHFYVSRANSEHPLWTVDQNVAFRIVHDVLGHCVSGGDFGWAGENKACAAHFPLLTPNAQKALFTECVGQTAYGAYYRSFGPQKVAFLDEFIEAAQQQENGAGHWGVHPSQSVAPTGMPEVSPSLDPTQYGGYQEGMTTPPHVQEQLGLQPVFTFRTAAIGRDPNAGWSSGIEPLPNNAFQWQGDPLDAHTDGGMLDTAGKVDTGWHKLTDGEGSQDFATMKQAIINAFRVVLLSPRKDLKWNAIHYQHIMGVPADVDDPKRYWDALERQREAWNQARGFAPGSHKPYWKAERDFFAYVRAMNPDLSEEEARRTAEKEWRHIWNDEEERIAADPKNQKLTADEVERKVAKDIERRILTLLKANQNDDTDVAHDQIAMFASVDDRYDDYYEDPDKWPGLFHASPPENRKSIQTTGLRPAFPSGTTVDDEQPKGVYLATSPTLPSGGEDIWYVDPAHLRNVKPDEYWMGGHYVTHPIPPEALKLYRSSAVNPGQRDLEGNEPGKYGAWMGSHLKAIAQISHYADLITKAALTDVEHHDGSGHHFRSTVLSLGVPGVGPKVCSFAWLLLQPLTSQLATIDVHMMDVLGHDYDKEMNDRDYFKFERELAAGRDAAGYGHVPLGAFQWGMWDHKRTGPGSHQDHSAMRVLDPIPHDQIDWNQKATNLKGEDWAKAAPPWWQETEPARQQVASDWDKNIATRFPRGAIPALSEREAVTASADAGSDDEFCLAFQIPQKIKNEITNWAAQLEWDGDFELVDPEEYHCTVLYAPSGWHDRSHQAWARQYPLNNLPMSAWKLELFGPGEDTLVLRLKSPEATKWAGELMDQGEARGLEISRFPGGYKPHITIAKGVSKIPKGKGLNLKFRSGPLFLYNPRPLQEDTELLKQVIASTQAPWFIDQEGNVVEGDPGQSIMQHLRGNLGLGTQDVWGLKHEVGKR